MQLIDTHAHLDQIDDVGACLKEAEQAGVSSIVAVGVNLEANERNLHLKKEWAHPEIRVGLGLHPSDIGPDKIDKTIKFIHENIKEASAIGEIGLDYWYKWVKKDKDKKQEQRDVYRRLLEVAKEHELPAVIHSRGAWEDCLEIAKQAGIKKAVFHWYSGPVDILDKILEMGYYVSATPSLAYSPQAQEAIRHAPISQTLIETDCPVYYRDTSGDSGFSSRPKDVLKTLELYADLKAVDTSEALDILNENARALFSFES